MPLHTLTNLRDQAREHADMETNTPGDDFIDDTQLTKRINEAIKLLRMKIRALRGPGFLKSEWTVTITAGLTDTPLPADLADLLGVRVQDQNGYWHNMDNFDHLEEVYLLNMDPTDACDVKYRLTETTLQLRPYPDKSYELVGSYIPEFADLVASTDTVRLQEGWDLWVVYSAAIMMKQKEESDPTILLAERAKLEQTLEELAVDRDGNKPSHIEDANRDEDFNVYLESIYR